MSVSATASIEVLPLENEEYYTGMRLPGDVYPADDPTNPR
jgi:hypothetical protein